jgi:hypothetical protein
MFSIGSLKVTDEQIRHDDIVCGTHLKKCMADTTLDVGQIPPAERHPKIHEAFESLDSGDSNDCQQSSAQTAIL